MDERPAPPAVEPPATLRHLGAFALVHFSLSLACCGFGFLILDDPVLVVLTPVLLIALYYPLGCLFGAPMEDTRQLQTAVLSQTAIAWWWAAMVIWAFFGENEGAFLILPVTFFLANPSSLLVLVGMFLSGMVGGVSPVLNMAFWAVPAGLLPPLLFNLGSYHATRKRALSER